MKTAEARTGWSFVLGFSVLLVAVLACNPVARFTKQYKCKIDGKADPQTPYEFVERGMEHIRAEQFDCALGACSEAIRLDSKLATGYACRGGVFRNQGEYLNALKDFDHALSMDSKNGEFYFSRAQVYRQLEKPDLALADLEKAIELVKSEFGRSVAYSERAAIYQKLGKLDDAIKDYTEAIRLAPDFAYHHNNRGDVYFEKKQFEKAIFDYSEAIRLDPTNEFLRKDRAKAYRESGQPELAIQDETALNITSSGDSNVISGGDLTDQAVKLPQPAYPPIARSARASGSVIVQVTVDERGQVVSANAVSGHPLLQAAAVAAARQAKFEPHKVSGKSVKVTGTIRYEFGG